MRICEIFSSLQGEGIQIGLPTIFVRTVGCNLGCAWCDTAYAWEGGHEMKIKDIARKIREYPQKNVCITGGEPLIQDDLLELLDLINDLYISVETNGSLDISKLVKKELLVSMDYKTPSSGMSARMRNENLRLLRPLDQLKFVMADKEDFRYAVEIISKETIQANIVFQPAWGTDIKIISELVLEEGLNVRVLPQLHKVIWGEKKGV